MPKKEDHSFLALLFRPPIRSKASTKAPPDAKKDTVPLAIWLQAGGSGPPPFWSTFLSLARRKADRDCLDREAAAAWDREKEAACKAVEKAWGRRGLGRKRPERKELLVWYAGYLTQKGEEKKEERNEGEGEPVMSGGNGDGDVGGDGGGEGEGSGGGTGRGEGDGQGNGGSGDGESGGGGGDA